MATNPKTGSEEFGELLRRGRERLGMSRRDLVEATGLSYPYISQLETGYRQPSPTAIQKLADALQLSLDDLFSAMARGRRDELSVSGTGSDSSSPLGAQRELLRIRTRSRSRTRTRTGTARKSDPGRTVPSRRALRPVRRPRRPPIPRRATGAPAIQPEPAP